MLSGIFLSVCVSYPPLSFVRFLRLFGAGRHGLSAAAQVASVTSSWCKEHVNLALLALASKCIRKLELIFTFEI